MADVTREDFLALLHKTGASVRGLARELGIKESTALNWVWKENNLRPDTERPRAEQTADAAAARIESLTKDKARLEHDLKFANAKLRLSAKEELSAEKVRTAILGLAAETPTPPDWLIEGRVGGSAPGVPVTIWSDWHWGERVRSQEAGGVNAFTTEIAMERVQRLVENTLDLAFDHMVRPDYPGAVICLGGDMVTGDIHEELTQTNETTTLQQVNELADVLAWAIEKMVDRFGRVFIPCVVGNHGRNTKRPRMKGAVFTNYDWLLYCLLERHFKNDDCVQFMIPEGADALFKVYGLRFLLTHGDRLGVKGGDGIIGALGPIMRGRIKLANSETQIGRDFDWLLMGHWHQYITLPGLVVNGTLKGYDEFARLALRAPYQRPTQALFFAHWKHGVTAHWPVFLESRPAQDAEWVAWRE